MLLVFFNQHRKTNTSGKVRAEVNSVSPYQDELKSKCLSEAAVADRERERKRASERDSEREIETERERERDYVSSIYTRGISNDRSLAPSPSLSPCSIM